MHVIKDVFDSIIETLLDMSRKSKHVMKSCTNLVQFELRPKLHSISRPNEKYFLPPVSYTLTAEEKKHSVNACVGCEYQWVSHPTLAN
jgi:hypothetical protein